MGFDNKNKNRDRVSAQEHQALLLILRRYVDGVDCYKIIVAELEKLGLQDAILALETIETLEDYSHKIESKLKKNLLKHGVGMIQNKKGILADKIKDMIIEMIDSAGESPKMRNSDYISKKLNHNYTYLSNTFKEVKGITIQQFIISKKIEKVKKLILNDELTLSEIAFKVHYSSAAHMSNQFKNITGLTPSHYRVLKGNKKSIL